MVDSTPSDPGTQANRVLLLSFLTRAFDASREPNKTQVVKTLFKTELDLRDRFSVPSYGFWRWDYGPFSTEICDDLRSLCAAGLLTGRTPTARGHELGAFIRARLAQTRGWSDVLASLDAAEDFICDMSASAAKRWSHDLTIKPTGSDAALRIHDMALGDDILMPQCEQGENLHLPEDVLEAFLCAASVADEDIPLMREPAETPAHDDW